VKRLNREEMLGIITTLNKANQLVIKIGAGSAEQAISVLTKCQESAITLGEALERYGEVGAQIIHMLEEYCEAIYQQSQCLNNAEVQKEFYNGIAVLLGLIEEKLQKELPEDKKVVVFLPYKASMWDSLESVWKAADEDPDCDAYVVPIPYFDKMPNGAFKEMHYEGADYPDYVPIHSWEEFSLPDMKPDLIFIHNPYDENNFVTTIHPGFYVPELRKYAKKIVYIPYFVLGEPNWETMSDEGKEKMRMFCIQPGVMMTDNTIVQSEAMKEVYVNTLCAEFGEEHRPMWEEKILGLGSPKLDKALETGTEDIVIPEEWKKVLYDADGCMKKVILYNNSVSALLEHGEKMIEKMRGVFAAFKEKQDEVAFLWRPHPLMKATIESMRPELWAEYEKLAEEYKQAGWGIYDNTTDLNRALELADIYYGDKSSLVQLCYERDIWVLMQDVEVAEEFLKNCVGLQYCVYPEIYNIVRSGEYLYGFAQNCNALLRVDLLKGKVTCLCSLPDQTEEASLVGGLKTYGDYIVCSPLKERQIYIYDIKKNQFALLQKGDEAETLQAGQTDVISIDGDNIYFFPYRGKNVIRMNIKDSVITYLDKFYNVYYELTGGKTESFYWRGTYQYEGKIYSVVFGTDYLIELSFQSEECELYSVGETLRYVQGYEDDLYLVTQNNNIVQWSITEKKVTRVWNVELAADELPLRLQGSIVVGNILYFLGKGTILVDDRTDFGVKVDTVQGTVSKFYYEDEFGIIPEKKGQYSFSYADEEGNLYFISTYQRMQIYNIHTKEIRKFTLEYGMELKRKNIKNKKETQLNVGEKCWREVR